MSADGQVGRLAAHFGSTPTTATAQAARWEPLWADGYSPWDRGGPSPALFDALRTESTLKAVTGAAASAAGTPRRALVPGCGTGYDVQLLASFGFDVVGLDTSATAVSKAEELTKKIQDGSEDRFPVQGERRGEVKFLNGDFFNDSWIEQVNGKGAFDLIYDYTVSALCFI
jgi:methyl halide transferase